MDRLEEIERRRVGALAFGPRHETQELLKEDVPWLLERVSELEEFKKGMFQELHDTEAELARGLGYKHDANYGWVTGDHTTVTLAMEAARRISELEAENERLKAEAQRLHSMIQNAIR